MGILRRNFLQFAGGAVASVTAPQIARTQAYPTRPVHIVVGYAPGLAPDAIARIISPGLSERLGQQLVVDNRPGAASNIATEIVARAAPNGYTLLFVVTTNAMNVTLYPNLKFNFGKDILPVASIGGTPFVMAVNPAFPAKTVSEFIAYAKAHPGKVNMASGGVGTTPHVFGELFKMMTGLDLVHVPYRSNYMIDLLGGQVELAFPSIPLAIEHIKSGKLRGLAVTTATASEALPGVPPLAQFVPGYEATGWYGICAPTGTPADIVEKLNAAVRAGLADPELKQRLLALGIEPWPMTPQQFGKFIADETEKWAKVIKFAAIKPD
jgi:tripartite-type tricarboxylate transporter receptor subunit TctC